MTTHQKDQSAPDAGDKGLEALSPTELARVARRLDPPPMDGPSPDTLIRAARGEIDLPADDETRG